VRPRILFHVQHLLGVGHLKRAEVLAQAMAGAGLDVTIALGGLPVPVAPFRGAAVAQLPPATIANEDFSTLLDAEGRPVDSAWKVHRRDALLALHRQVDPDVLLIELFPFGRRQFRFELIPLLDAARAQAHPPRIACSVRDILVGSKSPGRNAEITGWLRQYFDAVLVHGDPKLIPFGATFTAAAEIADLIRYTGYVAAETVEPPSSAGQEEVLVSAGGGAVGAPLFLAALHARPMTALKHHVWRFLTGPNLPHELFDRIASASDERTIMERFRADFPARLRTAALSISQAGYNTTMDILRSGVRAVVIPYEDNGETEQRLRSEILAQQGVLTVVPAAGLSPESLAEGIAAALRNPKASAPSFNLAGAATAARMIATLAEQRVQRTGR
jgi:predicted glycosyltransferase